CEVVGSARENWPAEGDLTADGVSRDILRADLEEIDVAADGFEVDRGTATAVQAHVAGDTVNRKVPLELLGMNIPADGPDVQPEASGNPHGEINLGIVAFVVAVPTTVPIPFPGTRVLRQRRFTGPMPIMLGRIAHTERDSVVQLDRLNRDVDRLTVTSGP